MMEVSVQQLWQQPWIIWIILCITVSKFSTLQKPNQGQIKLVFGSLFLCELYKIKQPVNYFAMLQLVHCLQPLCHMTSNKIGLWHAAVGAIYRGLLREKMPVQLQFYSGKCPWPKPCLYLLMELRCSVAWCFDHVKQCHCAEWTISWESCPTLTQHVVTELVVNMVVVLTGCVATSWAVLVHRELTRRERLSIPRRGVWPWEVWHAHYHAGAIPFTGDAWKYALSLLFCPSIIVNKCSWYALRSAGSWGLKQICAADRP